MVNIEEQERKLSEIEKERIKCVEMLHGYPTPVLLLILNSAMEIIVERLLKAERDDAV